MLEIVLFFELLLCEVLPLDVDPVVEQGRSSLQVRGEFLADFFGYESDEIVDFDIFPFEEFVAIFESVIPLGEYLVGLSEHIECLDVEIRFNEIKGAHLFNDSEGNKVENCLEFEIVVGGGSPLIEIDEAEFNSWSALKHSYSGWKFFTRKSSKSFSLLPGGGCRHP